jgi:hypothetical protein
MSYWQCYPSRDFQRLKTMRTAKTHGRYWTKCGDGILEFLERFQIWEGLMQPLSPLKPPTVSSSFSTTNAMKHADLQMIHTNNAPYANLAWRCVLPRHLVVSGALLVPVTFGENREELANVHIGSCRGLFPSSTTTDVRTNSVEVQESRPSGTRTSQRMHSIVPRRKWICGSNRYG